MSYQAMWFLIPAPADVVERHGPRLRTLLDAHAADPGNRALRRRWEREGLAPEELEELAVGLLGEDPDGLYAVWEDCGTAGPCAAVQARNRYPVLGLAHGLGPERTAGLPGWFGDVVVGPEEVRAALPAVEAVFDLDGAERRAAERRALDALRTDDLSGLFDAVLPVWRAAAEAGHGLIGAQFVP
ncbi:MULTISPECIES: hypothetical protein [Streptomycetaceae]|uniref:hypothetical protein n=1 Tax=Streptomycetaceae TaxID=2062 RepID=UPI00093AAACF|nr:hypothetical protein [Streptomyces sp. CB02056]OKH99579.1 hypothetical protein AMK13_34745 [Streptomyces sp. CB02056]